MASYNQQSQRYVNFGAADSFVVPPSISANAEAEAVFLQAMEDARVAYDRLVELGLAEGRTRESVQEDARFVLPNAAETKIVVTMNARELRHFFQVRCCNRAQWEIRDLAWTMRGMVKELAPNLFERQRPRLPVRHVPRGQDDLRQAVQARGRRRSGRRACAADGTAAPLGLMIRRLLIIAFLLPALAARRAQVGGQAVIEGVMMRGVDWWSLAVRRPDDSIGVHQLPAGQPHEALPVLKLPVLRGVDRLRSSPWSSASGRSPSLGQRVAG